MTLTVPTAPNRVERAAIGFLLLFVAYQIPEGIGQRLLGSFLVQAILLLAFFAVAYAVGRALGPTVPEAYGLEYSPAVMRSFLMLFGVAIVSKLVAVGVGTRLGIFQGGGVVTSGPGPALLFGLVETFAPSLAEDIVTRGFWLRASGIQWRPATFVLATSGIYVLNHIYRLGMGPGEWLMLLGFGLTYGLAVVRFRSLWPAVGLHWGWNYGNLLVSTVRPVTTLSDSGSRMLAITAHAVLAVFVLWLGRRKHDSLPHAA